MPGFKDFTSTVLTSADVDGYLMQQAVIQCTSSTRPSSPHEGMTVFETDTEAYSFYDGSAWRTLLDTAWRTYTPTVRFAGGGGSSRSDTGNYRRIGSTGIQFEVTSTFNVSLVMSGELVFDLPANISTEPTNLGQPLGIARCLGASRRSGFVTVSPGSLVSVNMELGDGTLVAGGTTAIWGTTVGNYCAFKASGFYRTAAG